MKHEGGGVLVWGGMVSSGVSKLVFIGNIMDKMVCLNILKKNWKENAAKLHFRQDFYVHSDNDSKHTTHIIRMWVAYNVAHTLPFPSQSSDLNPILHLWAEFETAGMGKMGQNSNRIYD